MTNIVIDGPVFEAVRAHLATPEQVGFFLADFDPSADAFILRAWRPVLGAGYELQTDFHVSLTDGMRSEIVHWAWETGKSLVEIHSHGDLRPAAFSWSDRNGFDDWVPHVWWRLRGKPYAALVWAGGSFDGWAWITDPRSPSQVDLLRVDGVDSPATRATFETGRRREGWNRA